MLKMTKSPNISGYPVKNGNNKVDRFGASNSSIEIAKKLRKSKG